MDYQKAMKIYNSLDEYQPNTSGTAVALGFFDGVHTGHRAVISGCAEKSGGLPCVVLTFRESPARTLGRPVPPLLCGNARKAELMGAAGADAVIFMDFSAVKNLSPEAFVQTILCEKLCAKKVFCGYNYHFGRGGAGDTAALQSLCENRGTAVSVLEPVLIDGEAASSSRIRERIARGDIAGANKLLGYRYTISGEIVSGNHIGTTIGVPTVNLMIPEGLIVPRYGVYASDVRIGERVYRGATDVGVHPTVCASEKPLCETFLLNFGGGDLYGQKASCELIEFIRPEQCFDNEQELTEQIKKDCERILAI